MARTWGVNEDALVVPLPGEQVEVRDVRVRSVPAHDPLEPEAIAFVIEWRGHRLFHSGDAHRCDASEATGLDHPIDLAFLNFGGGSDHWYMNAEEVLAMAELLRAKTIVPMHWDAWKRSLPTVEDVVKLRSAQSTNVHFMVMGDRLILSDT